MLPFARNPWLDGEAITFPWKNDVHNNSRRRDIFYKYVCWQWADCHESIKFHIFEAACAEAQVNSPEKISRKIDDVNEDWIERKWEMAIFWVIRAIKKNQFSSSPWNPSKKLIPGNNPGWNMGFPMDLPFFLFFSFPTHPLYSCTYCILPIE